MNQPDLFDNRDRTYSCTVHVDVRRAPDEDNKTTYGENRIEWVWECPACGSRTIATKSEHTTPDQIKADARCCYCRWRGRTVPNAQVEFSEGNEV